MKTKIRILLTAALALLLTACGGSSPAPEKAAPAYQAAFFDAGLAHEEFLGSCAGTGGDTGLYLLTLHRDSEELDHGCLYRYSEDRGLENILVTDEILDGKPGYVRSEAIQPGAEGALWLTMYGGAFEAEEYRYCLWQVDGEGNGGKRIDLTKLIEKAELDRLSGAFVEGSGWVYLVSGDTIHVFNEGLTHRFTLDARELLDKKPVRLSDGRLGFLAPAAEGASGCRVRTVDRDRQGWGESYDLPEGCGTIFTGSGDYLFYCGDGSVLWGWREGWEPLADWLTAGVSPESVKSFIPLDGGRMNAVAYENGAVTLVELTPAGDLPEKTVITVAGLGDSSTLRRMAAEFNRTSDTCRVVYKYYDTQVGNWFSWEERQRALARLMADITAGNVPDILYVQDVPVRQLAAKELLEDLWPYIEEDPELGREALMTHVLECAEQDGRLYQIFPKFVISSVVGAADVVGDRIRWTQEDLRVALASMPEDSAVFIMEDPQNDLLESLLYEDLNSFVDWETGSCSFDSQEFRDILKFCGETKQEEGDLFDTYTMIPEGKAMLQEGGMSNFLSIQGAEALFGRPVSYVGYPRQDGGCGSGFSISGVSLAMTTTCRDKENAWAFMRRLLLPQGLDIDDDLWKNARFPINREDFDLLLQWSMTAAHNEAGEAVPKGGESASTENGVVFSSAIYAATQEDYEQFLELYNAIDHMSIRDRTIWEIVGEEAQPYFAGDKSLEETVRLIQSRVGLYVNEQR